MSAYYKEFEEKEIDQVASGYYGRGRSSYGVSGYSHGGAGAGGMDVEILIREVQDNTQHFSSNVASLERKTKLLNTAEDSVKLREEIIQLSKDTVQLAKITDSSLKKLNQQTTGTGQSDRLAYGRLTKAFQLSLQKFQPLQQSVADLEQDLVTRARSASSVRTPDSASFQPEFERAREPLVHHDSLARERQMQIEENEAAQLEEREREMRQLETDILDINDIFRDLGTMVHDQGDLVDNIETQVETAAVRVESGNTQLAKAVRHKKCSRKLTCCIACILLGILAAVIIAVFVLLAIFTDLFKKKN